MLDLLGRSLLDYQRGDRSDDVHVETNISEREILFRSHFFPFFLPNDSFGTISTYHGSGKGIRT